MRWNAVFTDVNIPAPGIEGSQDSASLSTRECDNFQHRQPRYGFMQHLGQSLHRSKADPDPGKRSRAGNHDETIEIVLRSFVSGKKCCNLRNKFRREGTSGQPDDFNDLDVAIGGRVLAGSRQRDAALPARRINGEKEHEKLFWLIRGT